MTELIRHNPIFIIPFPRMGATLFNTMLDAHPDLAMSYEIYEEKLFNEAGRPFSMDEALDAIRAARKRDCEAWTKAIGHKGLKSFVACARRGDIEVNELLQVLENYKRAEGSFVNINGRLSFIEQLMIYKMKKNSRKYWGGKAKVDPWKLYERYSGACFFAMIRDGRDVLASQLDIGTFKMSPAEMSKEWREFVLRFQYFSSEPGVRARFVKYEDLVCNPEAVINDVCSFIGIDYSNEMLSFHKKELSLFRNPHGHLSHKQIAQGINELSIGRWKHDLASKNVDIFMKYNSDLLAEYGYDI